MMKGYLFVSLLLIAFNSALSAGPKEEVIVDSCITKKLINIRKPQDLAERVNADFNTDFDKAKAIYTWIGQNIAYDMRKYNRFKKQEKKKKAPKRRTEKKQFHYERKIAAKTMRKGKGICMDYAFLYKHLCDLTQLDCRYVSGYSKTANKRIGSKFGEKHAWNVVRIGEQWHLLDVTWGAGTVNDEEQFIQRTNNLYFMTDPDLFFMHHFPRDQQWLLTDKSREDFAIQPLYHRPYMISEVILNAPSRGVIQAEKGEMISFEIDNVSPGDVIHFKYEKQEIGHVVSPVFNDHCMRFEIIPGARRLDYLTVYLNYEPLATFKVKLK